MKILQKLSPKRLFRSAGKSSRRSVSRSEPASFSSGSEASSSSSSSSSSSLHKGGAATPTTVLPSQISRDSISSDLVQAFKLIDKDGDGKITREELASLLTRLGSSDPPTEGELLAMIREVDRDGDGCISLEEFRAIGSVFEPACGSELRDLFDFFDMDRDGRITAEELRRVFEAIGDDDGCTIDDCRRMIDGVNKSGGGFVCFEDFARMMEPQL